MQQDRLSILCVSHMPPSPPRCGAQARVHGLLTQLAARHDVTAVMLVDEDEFDADDCREALEAFCGEVALVPNPYGRHGLARRMLQLRSVASGSSFERIRVTLPALQSTLDRILRSKRFDIVNLEFPYLGHYKLRQAPSGEDPPRLVVDSHEVAFDLARQFARTGASLGRRLYAEVNWRKLKREELQTYRSADGVYLCSIADRDRLHRNSCNVPTAIVPNAADVDYFQPKGTDPAPDGATVLYFGLLATTPNRDAVSHFLQDVWPRIAETDPRARCKIVGGRPPQSLLELAGPRVEFTGFVEDLRPHLAAAAVVVVPLRLGGGTRLKIVEAMAMGKAIVSTRLGVEGIEAVPGRDILVENDPDAFANAVIRILTEPGLAARIGASARQLAVDRYGWSGAARDLERFYRRLLGSPRCEPH
jgi:glycosyltransferase involved in cell wall biosynthesis